MAVGREGVVKCWKENIIETSLVTVFIQPEILFPWQQLLTKGCSETWTIVILKHFSELVRVSKLHKSCSFKAEWGEYSAHCCRAVFSFLVSVVFYLHVILINTNSVKQGVKEIIQYSCSMFDA